MRISRFFAGNFVRTALAAAFAIMSAPAYPQSEADPVAGADAPAEVVGSTNGSLAQRVPIEVPPFRGLEPNLAFTYNSSDRIGPLGVGWSLSGLSVIERNSPGFGTARHDASDIFVLDSSELVACTTTMTSPACTTAGITDHYWAGAAPGTAVDRECYGWWLHLRRLE